MLRTALILLVGVLVGANLVYFAMHHDDRSAETVVFDAAPSPTTTPGDSAPASASTNTSPVADAPPPPTAGTKATPPGDRPLDPDLPPGERAPDPLAIKTEQPLPGTTPGWPAAAADKPSGLLVPVKGILASRLTNTFDDARGSGRRHDALDIMAARGTPVLAVADGKVEKLFDSDRGGLTIYQFEPTGRYAYYYAHLDRYASGLKEGKAISKGEVIGYVGSTGNAAEDAPHLHFAIFRLGPEKHWWEGDAINPYPVLTGRPGATAKSP